LVVKTIELSKDSFLTIDNNIIKVKLNVNFTYTFKSRYSYLYIKVAFIPYKKTIKIYIDFNYFNVLVDKAWLKSNALTNSVIYTPRY
jgi:hypothetical protein